MPLSNWHWLTVAGGTFESDTDGTFHCDIPGTFQSAVDGTFDSATDGTFQSDMGGTFGPLLSFKRCVSYCCRSYDRLTVKGAKKNDAEDDNKLVPKGYDVPPLFFIGFMGAEVRHEDKQAWEGRFISEYTFMEKTTHELQDETIIIIFAELNRFNKSEKECVTAQDKLMYLFKNISKLENDKTWDRDRFWQRFFKACEIAAFNEEKRTQYEQDMYDERRLYGQLTASYNNGLAEGREKGLAEGREAERLENAKKLVASGVDIDLVCSTLGVDKSILQEK